MIEPVDRKVRQIRAAAAKALERALGVAASALVCQPGGLSNHVFKAETALGQLIVRLGSSPDKAAAFVRERQVVDHVRAAGIPAPEILAVGEVDGWAFMIARCLPGEPAVHHQGRLRVLEYLGRLARRIHAIRTVGYGRVFHWEQDGVVGAPEHHRETGWRDWLDGELAASARLAFLHTQAMISDVQLETLIYALNVVGQWREAPALNHGDLRLKNVIVDADGRIEGLIDWEASVSSAGPHWDLSLALHDLSVDAKEAFLAGYGLSEPEIRSAAPAWRLFNVLNYAPKIERLVARGDLVALERMRTRLSGALDLYGRAW